MDAAAQQMQQYSDNMTAAIDQADPPMNNQELAWAQEQADQANTDAQNA